MDECEHLSSGCRRAPSTVRVASVVDDSDILSPQICGTDMSHATVNVSLFVSRLFLTLFAIRSLSLSSAIHIGQGHKLYVDTLNFGLCI